MDELAESTMKTSMSSSSRVPANDGSIVMTRSLLRTGETTAGNNCLTVAGAVVIVRLKLVSV